MSDHENHVVGLKVYFTIITILMVLTAITVWAAFQDFGFLNNVVAITIAVIKAVLVVVFFMHLRGTLSPLDGTGRCCAAAKGPVFTCGIRVS